MRTFTKVFSGMMLVSFAFLFGRCYHCEYAAISEMELLNTNLSTNLSTTGVLFMDLKHVNEKLTRFMDEESKTHDIHGFVKLNFDDEKGFILYFALRDSEWWYERFCDSYLCVLESNIWNIIEAETGRYDCMSGSDIIPSSIPIQRKIFWIKNFAWSGKLERDKIILAQILRENETRMKVAYLDCLKKHCPASRVEEFTESFLSDSDASIREKAMNLQRDASKRGF